MRLIDADALKDNVDNVTWYHITDKGKMVEGSTSDYVSFYRREDVIAAIDNAPTVEAEPVKHGEWIEEPDRRFRWHCSECGYVIGVVKMDCNYCPNCGARMDGEENEID